MRQVFKLEYRILDKIGRTKKKLHVGYFSTEEKVDAAKKEIELEMVNKNIMFDIFIHTTI